MKYLPLLPLFFALAFIGCSASHNGSESTATITPAESVKFLGTDAAVVFLDVRTPAEYKSETGHLQGAILIPVDTLESRMQELEPYKSKTIIAYCRSGKRSARAQKLLASHGYRAFSMSGGITRWNTEQLPVVKEP